MADDKKTVILVVDDDEAGRNATARVIKAVGFDIIEAGTGYDALEKAKRNPGLIVLDIALPDISGLEVCRRLKADSQTGHIPVLYLTGTYLKIKDKVVGLESGADGYLTHPVEPAELIATINSLLRLKRAEEELQRKQAMLERTEGIAHVGSWEWDLANDTVTWSAESFRQYKLDPADGLPSYAEFLKLFYPEDAARLNSANEAAISEGTPYELELRAILPDGETRYHLARCHVETGPDGKARRLFGSSQDITERKKAEEGLREEKALYHTLFNQSPDGVLIIDAQTALPIMFNDTVCRQLGYTREEFALLRINDYDAVERPDVTRSRIEKVLREGRDDFETQHHTKTGEVRNVQVIVQTVELSGQLVFHCIFRDITELRQAEEAIRQSESKFRMLFDQSSDGIFVLDMKGSFIDVNQTAHERLGYTKEEMLAISVRDIDPPEFAARVPERLAKIVKDGQAIFESAHLRKDGTVMPVEINARIIEFGGQKVFFSVIRDITERKHVEAELKRYAETQEALLREVNHRVKNNLAVLLSMLHKEEDKAKQKGMAGHLPMLTDLHDRIESLLIVHSMLSSKEWRDINLTELCRNLIKRLSHSHGGNITSRITEVDITVNSNQAHYLALVINELATNSLKYAATSSSQPAISVAISRDGNKIKLVYSDNGPGYPDSIIKGDYSGTSIGFELLNGIVRQSLRGKISYRNENGAVTEIVFPA